jgi:hypothetical protein
LVSDVSDIPAVSVTRGWCGGFLVDGFMYE